jgi:DNA-binding CsgD family transcriptional regulator
LVIDGITTLLDRSLIHRSEDDDQTARFSMLETIREFGLEALAASGEEEAVRAAHAAHFVALGEGAEPALRGPDQQRWMDRLESEHDNLRAALEWCQAHDAEAGLRLAGSIGFFWVVRGYYGEGRQRLEALLALALAPTASRARSLDAACLLAREQADLAGGISWGEEGLAIHRALGDKQGCATALRNLGFLFADLGDRHRARAMVEESLALARETGDEPNIAFTIGVLGCQELLAGNHQRAVACLEECATRFQQLGDRRGYAVAMGNLGHVLWDKGDDIRARALYDECLTISREIGNKRSLAYTLSWLGNHARSQGDTRQASAFLAESLSLHSIIGDRLGIAYGISLCGLLAMQYRDHALGLMLLAAAVELHSPLEIQLTQRERADRDAFVDAARVALGDAAFDEVWATGRAMAGGQAIALAENMLNRKASNPSILSPREREVLELIAEGKQNREIAAQLFLSHRTVEAHVASILTKLDVGSRHQAVSKARDQGLLSHP